MTSTLGSFLSPAGFAGPTGVSALVREGSAVVETARGLQELRADRRRRRAEPMSTRSRPIEPVLLVPGFMAGDWSLTQMSARLRYQGLRTYRAGITVNAGCTRRAADRLERRVESVAIRRDSKVTIVGHSLGGMLARALAARRPDLVAGIITLGSPVLAPGAVHQLLAWDAAMLTRLSNAGIGGLMSEDCVAGRCARESWAETAAPLSPEIGYTAIYSRRDGVVDWRSCLDPFAQRQVEVRASHCGMAVDPATFTEIVEALDRQRFSRASSPEAPSAGAGSLRAVSM